jgi:hypothetical protein
MKENDEIITKSCTALMLRWRQATTKPKRNPLQVRHYRSIQRFWILGKLGLTGHGFHPMGIRNHKNTV